jgi:serine/threonine-protein kinase
MRGDPDVVLGDLLGAGGMGRVFAAEDSKHAPVAVKVLHEVLASDPIMVDRFLDEGRAAQRVTHRNVVRVFDHGMSAAGTPFLVMERVPGIPLGSLIQREGSLPFFRIRAIAAQIFAGLAAIHRAGLVHGDLKSDNILVDESDRVTIIDFGLARTPGTRPAFGDDQMLTGTPEYMAPELIRGEPISTASELYAVGVILYEMLTGSTPGGGGTTTAIFERHLSDELVPPTLRCPDRTIPVSLEAVILRALDKDPAARHLNADIFATAVDRSVPADCTDRIPHGADRSDRSDLHADADAPTRSDGAPRPAQKAAHPPPIRRRHRAPR